MKPLGQRLKMPAQQTLLFAPQTLQCTAKSIATCMQGFLVAASMHSIPARFKAQLP
jgi:hypothetical protein